MNSSRTLLFVVALLVSVGTRPLAGLDLLHHAREAQALLGPDVWSKVIRIENRAPSDDYPRVVHALVFELAGLLWFYDAAHGTQSFSLHRNRLAEERANFAPLLKAIDAGFGRWSEASARWDLVVAPGKLPNGCFVESVAALQARREAGVAISAPRLFSYYAQRPSGRVGHTVLVYDSGEHLEVIDPAQPGSPLRLSRAVAHDPRQLARTVAGFDVSTTRWLPLDIPAAAEPRRGVETLAAGGDVPPAQRATS